MHWIRLLSPYMLILTAAVVLLSSTQVFSAWPEPILVEYPESITQIDHLESVQTPWAAEMSYCSLIARLNLQRFTGLPVTNTFDATQEAVVQGDAIRLLEQWLATKQLLPVQQLAEDMQIYFPSLAPFTLIDLYIYTPHPDETLSEKDYLLQGHRVVGLYAYGVRWVMDPLSGTKSPTWQQRELYKTSLDPTAMLFVYRKLYTFADTYEQTTEEFAKRREFLDISELDDLVYQGIIVPEVDADLMPLAQTFLKPVTMSNTSIHLAIPVGMVIRSADSSPFQIGATALEVASSNAEDSIEVSIGFSEKPLIFSAPVMVSVDIADGEDAAEYKLETPSGCLQTGEEGMNWATLSIVDGKIFFPLCQTGKFLLTKMWE